MALEKAVAAISKDKQKDEVEEEGHNEGAREALSRDVKREYEVKNIIAATEADIMQGTSYCNTLPEALLHHSRMAQSTATSEPACSHQLEENISREQLWVKDGGDTIGVKEHGNREIEFAGEWEEAAQRKMESASTGKDGLGGEFCFVVAFSCMSETKMRR